MKTYDRFIFESYRLDAEKRTIHLNYSFDSAVVFQEVLTLPASLDLSTDNPDLEAALFSLHLAGGASYYKLYSPPRMEVKSGQLTQSQADFWNKLYTLGLGEFFYVNKIDYRGLINFPVTASEHPRRLVPAAQARSRALVPYGGGKDSIVTSQLLASAGTDQTLFRLRPSALITNLAHTAKLPLLEVERSIAPELFELTGPDSYNGHVPITSFISFLTVVVSLLGGFDRIFFSNERSSSYGNVEYLGMTVNHQWSKSLEFEKMLTDYLAKYVTASVKYLNLLRPLSELQIAKLFSKYPQYFSQATSCNRNWRLNQADSNHGLWCGECPKCAFSFALLAGFLEPETVIKMFGKNLFEDPSLIELYQRLWGSLSFKPFECVGTPEEVQAAFYLASKFKEYEKTVAMQYFKQHILPNMKDPKQLVQSLFVPDLTDSPADVANLIQAETS